jgi:hypothetical protein
MHQASRPLEKPPATASAASTHSPAPPKATPGSPTPHKPAWQHSTGDPGYTGTYLVTEDEAIGTIDRFALQRRLPNGKTVLDQFLVSWPDPGAADRDMLRLARPGGRDLRDPPQGRDSLILLNLVDDLEYRAYSNMGPAAAQARIRVRPLVSIPRFLTLGWSPGR